MGNLHRVRPFYFRGGPVGCLLIHGYTDGPGSMLGLGQRLAAEGLTVRCDVLPGHGTDPHDLNRHTWRHWWDAVVAGHDALARECTHLIAAGLSFGGTLALHLATHRPLAGVVTLAGMLSSSDARAAWAGPLSWLVPMVAKSGGPDVSSAAARADYAGYDHIPLGGLAQVMALIRHVSDDLACVRCPILVVHGRHDHTVPLADARTIVDGVSSTDRRLLVLERSWHVVTLDADREELEQEVAAFVRRHGPG
jgi:carboxylesterase